MGVVERGYGLDELLRAAVRVGASDLHLTVGLAPCVRVDGVLHPMAEAGIVEAGEVDRLVVDRLSASERERFVAEHDLDTSLSIEGLARFRLNVFRQRDATGAVLRAIPFRVAPLEDLGLPPQVAGFADLHRGLVLVTGPTGSGKSTTLASLVDRINRTRACHIVTIEDPVEFLHDHRRSIVNQREVGRDTGSFQQALRSALRQDPDVILVGELRDLETIAAALSAAETGHLVLATLHTQDAPQAIDRMIDVFPGHQQQQVRIQLALTLQAVVTQQLLPLAVGRGRAVAAEVLVATPSVRNLIREGKTHQLASAMQTGAQAGMRTMETTLAGLVACGRISPQTAIAHAGDPDEVAALLRALPRPA